MNLIEKIGELEKNLALRWTWDSTLTSNDLKNEDFVSLLSFQTLSKVLVMKEFRRFTSVSIICSKIIT